MIEIVRTSSADEAFGTLVEKLNAFLAVINGERHDFYSQFNRTETIPNVVLAYTDGRSVGCGAFRWLDGGTVEIKRMYVGPSERGKGVGRQILMALEAWASEMGASRAVLETSKRLTAAIRLYQSFGYGEIPNYGPYAECEESVCMAKMLTLSAISDLNVSGAASY